MTTPDRPLRMTDDTIQPLKRRYGYDIGITEVRSPLFNDEPPSVKHYTLRAVPLSLDHYYEAGYAPYETAPEPSPLRAQPLFIKRVARFLLG